MYNSCIEPLHLIIKNTGVKMLGNFSLSRIWISIHNFRSNEVFVKIF